jgi:prevent-host-death family protein
VDKRYCLTTAQSQLAEIVLEVEKGRTIELTRRGVPVAVILSAAEYARLAAVRPSLAAATAAFREREALEAADLAAAFDGVRDPAPGRDLEL